MRRILLILVSVVAALAQGPTSPPDPRWQTRGKSGSAGIPGSCVSDRDVWICDGAGCSSAQRVYYCIAGVYESQGGGGAGSGITSLNGLTSVTQNFVNDANITIVSSSSNHTITWVGTQSVSRGGIGVGTLTGIAKGNGTSAFTAAVVADVISLFSGTCNSSTFLKGDGSCGAGGGSGANPGGSPGQLQYQVNSTTFGGFSPQVNTVAITTPSALNFLNGAAFNGITPTFVNSSAGIVQLGLTGTLGVAGGGTGVATLTGVVKASGTSAFSAAASADIIALWSGSCSSSTFLRGDGACASAGGTTAWSAITNPSGNLALSMATNTTTLTYALTGSGNGFQVTDSGAGSTGILMRFTTPNASTTIPFQTDVNGNGWQLAADGSWKSVGSTVSGRWGPCGITSLNCVIISVLDATAAGAWTVPGVTDTFVGKATTDIFTGKSYDTAGLGNVFKIAGITVSAVSGTGNTVCLTVSCVMTTPNLGTPSVLTLTNATGLPIAGITGLGTGVGTLLGTFTSANLAAALPDETGTGPAVFAGSPVFTGTPVLSTATATSINKVAFTQPATGSTLTVDDGLTMRLQGPQSLTFTIGASGRGGGTVNYRSGSGTMNQNFAEVPQALSYVVANAVTVTANHLVKLNTDGTIGPVTGTEAILGIVETTLTGNGTTAVLVDVLGTGVCISEGTIIQGNYSIAGIVDPSACLDSGSASLSGIPVGTRIAGRATAGAATGTSFGVNLFGPLKNGAQLTKSIVATFDAGDGSVLSGTSTRCQTLDYAGTIKQATLVSDVTGSVTVDVRTVPYASYTGPASTSSITAAAIPALSGAAKFQDSTLTGWTAAIGSNTASTEVCFFMSSPATIQWANLTLKVTVP